LTGGRSTPKLREDPFPDHVSHFGFCRQCSVAVGAALYVVSEFPLCHKAGIFEQ